MLLQPGNCESVAASRPLARLGPATPGPGAIPQRRIIARHAPPEKPIKFTRESADTNLVRAWRRGGLRIGDEWLRSHAIVSADRIVRDWPVSKPENLQPDDLEPALATDPDIIILGTGEALRRPVADLMGLMAERGIGVEIMDTPAACRTYNVLLHEGRSVVAALFIP